jgi:hypothetical protein
MIPYQPKKKKFCLKQVRNCDEIVFAFFATSIANALSISKICNNHWFAVCVFIKKCNYSKCDCKICQCNFQRSAIFALWF